MHGSGTYFIKGSAYVPFKVATEDSFRGKKNSENFDF